MKYRPKIGPGDFDTKTRQVAKFLAEGHKVKITIMFRGREVYHPEHGKRILDRIAEQMEGIAKIEAEPKLDNRNMIMVLAPDKRARQAAQSKASNQQRAERGAGGGAGSGRRSAQNGQAQEVQGGQAQDGQAQDGQAQDGQAQDGQAPAAANGSAPSAGTAGDGPGIVSEVASAEEG
jgi:translation initiation factor IF-3